MKRPGEFDLIAKYFAPLAAGMPGALGLGDDAAIIAPQPGHEIVTTVDALTEGVHFLPGDPPGDIARKMLRCNLSDLAAMGARPIGYVMTIALTKRIDEAWIAAFTAGLAEDQRAFGIGLLGGDTTSTPGLLSLTVTAFGDVPTGKALRRNGSRAGDRVMVSGTIGDGALGLLASRGELSGLDARDRNALVARYRLPQPRLKLGAALLDRGLVTAALDVSDGLVADLGHICEQSHLSATLFSERVPLSDAARRIVSTDPDKLPLCLTGGDDYELVFTIDPMKREAVLALGRELDLPITEIGYTRGGQGVRVLAPDGLPAQLDRTGWQHY